MEAELEPSLSVVTTVKSQDSSEMLNISKVCTGV